jgi:group I intron endonuclease
MNRYGSIYVVTNTVTGEQYVGQTRQKALRRWKCHVNTANSKVATKYKLAQAILEHGANAFKFAEFFSAFDAAALDIMEVKLIEELSPAYNIAKGGAGHRGVVPSAEICKARSERLKRQWADPDWREIQIEKIKQVAATPEATERGRKVAVLGTAARWANHVKKTKAAPRAKVCKPARDPLLGRYRSARAKWKPVYCPELKCSFLSQKAAAEFLCVLKTSVANAVKQKGRVRGMYTLEKVV